MQTFENNENAIKGLSNIIPEDEEKKSNAARLSSRHEDFDDKKLKTEDTNAQRSKLKSLADIYGSANKVPSKQEVPNEEKSKVERNVSSPDPLASTYETTTIQGINNANGFNGSKPSKISLGTNKHNKLDPLDINNIPRDDPHHSRRRSKLRPLGQTSSRQTIHSQNDDEDLSSINASALGYAFRRGSKQQNGFDGLQIQERRRSHFGDAAEAYANILVNPPLNEDEEDTTKKNPTNEEEEIVSPYSPKDKVLTYRQTLGEGLKSIKLESAGVRNKADLDVDNPDTDDDIDVDENENEIENNETGQAVTPVYQHQSMSSAKLGTLADPMTLSQAQNNLQNESYKRFMSINQYGSNKARELLPFEVPSAGFEEIQLDDVHVMDTLDVGRPSFHHRDHKDINAITEEDSAYDPKRSQNKLENTFRSSENIAGENDLGGAGANENQDESISMDGEGHIQEEKDGDPMGKYLRKSPTSARQRTTSDGFLQFESTKLQTHRNPQNLEDE